MAYRTKFIPKNKLKYIGNPDKINCRSLWERNVCKFFDENRSIVKWAFEEIVIPYVSPIDQKIRNYYPDFLVEFVVAGEKKIWLIEVKPRKQTYLKENATKNEKLTWTVNTAKWNAAKSFCEKNKIEFKLLTERELFNNAK